MNWGADGDLKKGLFWTVNYAKREFNNNNLQFVSININIQIFF